MAGLFVRKWSLGFRNIILDSRENALRVLSRRWWLCAEIDRRDAC